MTISIGKAIETEKQIGLPTKEFQPLLNIKPLGPRLLNFQLQQISEATEIPITALRAFARYSRALSKNPKENIKEKIIEDAKDLATYHALSVEVKNNKIKIICYSYPSIHRRIGFINLLIY